MPKLLAECLTLTWTDLAQELAGSKVALVPLTLGRVPLMDFLHAVCLPAVRIVLPADYTGRNPAQGPALPTQATWSLPADGQEGAVPTYRLTSTQCLTLPDTWEFIYHELLSTTDAFFIICLDDGEEKRDVIAYADQIWAACGSMLPVGCRRGLWYAGPTRVPPAPSLPVAVHKCVPICWKAQRPQWVTTGVLPMPGTRSCYDGCAWQWSDASTTHASLLLSALYLLTVQRMPIAWW